MGPRFEILDAVDTAIGTLYLRRREMLGRPGTIVTEVTIGPELLMSSLNTASEEALATHAIAWHAGGRDGLAALVGGLGLGFTAHAALATGRVGRLRVVERVPEVIGWFETGKVPLAAELAGDPRVTLAVGDVYAELLGPPGADRWDAVLIDVDHGPTERLDEASAPFYTEAGLRRVAEHLAPGGVLAVWSAEDDEPFFDALGTVFAGASRERVRWRNELIEDGQDVEDVLFLARR